MVVWDCGTFEKDICAGIGVDGLWMRMKLLVRDTGPCASCRWAASDVESGHGSGQWLCQSLWTDCDTCMLKKLYDRIYYTNALIT